MLPQVQNLEFIRLAKDFITRNPTNDRGQFIQFIFQNSPKLINKKMKYRKDAEKGYDFVKIMIRDNIDESEWISGGTYVYERNIIDSNKRPFDDSMSDCAEPIPKKPKLKHVSNNKDFSVPSNDGLMENFENLLHFRDYLETYMEDIINFKPHTRKQILISGPNKCGKTTFIQWTAQKHNYQYIKVKKTLMDNFSCDTFVEDIEKFEMTHGKCLFHLDFNLYSTKIADNFKMLYNIGKGEGSLVVYETSDPEPLERWSDYHLKFRTFDKLDRQRCFEHFLCGYKLGQDLTYEEMTKSTPAYQIGELKAICGLLQTRNQIIDKKYFTDVLKDRKIKQQFVANEVIEFSDIGGHDEVKEKLLDIKRKLLDTNSQFEKDGIILYGPPGCGKTMLAKALSNETEFTFISVSIPDIFSKYQGESEKNVRDFFEKARSCQPSILFIDEIDAMCSERDDGNNGSKNTIVNTFLTQMDGVATDRNERVLVIGATNFIDRIDIAIKRSKRMGILIEVNIPKNDDQRFDVLMAASKSQVWKIFGTNPRGDANCKEAAIFREISHDKYTDGWNHSDLATLISQSYASMRSSNGLLVTMEHVMAAYSKISIERKMNNKDVSKEFDENTTKIFIGEFEKSWMTQFVFDERLLNELHIIIRKEQVLSQEIHIGGHPCSGKSTLIRYLAQKYQYNLVRMEKSYERNFNIDRFYRDFSQFVKKNGPTLLHIVDGIAPFSMHKDICNRFTTENWASKILVAVEHKDVSKHYINIPSFSEENRLKMLQNCLRGLSFVPKIDEVQFLKCTSHWTDLHFFKLNNIIDLLEKTNLEVLVDRINVYQ